MLTQERINIHIVNNHYQNEHYQNGCISSDTILKELTKLLTDPVQTNTYIQAYLEFRGFDIRGFEYSRFMTAPNSLYGCPQFINCLPAFYLKDEYNAT